MLKLIFIVILILISLPDLLAQVGCRRISDGHLFIAPTNLDGTYFIDIGDHSAYCLPLNDPGTPCSIRTSLTTTVPGIHGTYSLLTCPIDDVLPLIFVSGIAGFLYIRKNQLS